MAEQKRGGPRGHGPQGHGFQRPKDLRGTVSKLLRYIGRYKAALVVVFICLVISSVGSVMSSYLLKPIINDYILVGDFAGLLKMLALLLGLFLLSGLCSYAYARIMVHISQRTVAQMRQDLFDKLQDLPLRYFDTHQSGDLMSRFTNDMDTVSEMINSRFASVVSCALTFIGIVVMMLYMNWVLTLITFAFLVLMLLVVKGVGGRSRVSFQAQLSDRAGNVLQIVPGQGSRFLEKPRCAVMTNFSPFKGDSELHPWMGLDRYNAAVAALDGTKAGTALEEPFLTGPSRGLVESSELTTIADAIRKQNGS